MRPDPPRIDATKFAAPALPPTWEAAPTGPAQVEVALAIIREGTEPEDVIGWVAGLSMFIDHDRYVIRTRLLRVLSAG